MNSCKSQEASLPQNDVRRLRVLMKESRYKRLAPANLGSWAQRFPTDDPFVETHHPVNTPAPPLPVTPPLKCLQSTSDPVIGYLNGMALLQRPEEVLERLAEVDAPLKPTTETSPQAHQLALLKAHPLIGYGNRALYATITYATKVLRS